MKNTAFYRLIVIWIVSWFFVPVIWADDQPYSVRVGFFAMEGFHEQSPQGIRSGYGYDVMSMVRKYANLNCQYVGYDKTWDEMLHMLQHGEIDVLGAIQKTPQRLKQFDFTQPIGETNTRLLIRPDEDRFITEQYDTYQNMVVGVMQGDISYDKLQRFARVNGIRFKTKIYANRQEQLIAIQKNEVDAIAVSNLFRVSDLITLESFENEYFYLAVRKGQNELLSQLNEAIEQMNLTESGWQKKLYVQYFETPTDNQLIFSEREHDFIQQYTTGGKTLVVALDDHWIPFARKNGARFQGVMVDYWQLIAQMTGINYTFYVPDEPVSDAQVLNQADVQLYIGYVDDAQSAERDHLLSTQPYLRLSASLLARKDVERVHRIGLCNNTHMLNKYLPKDEEAEYVYFDHTDAAIEALQNEDIDGIYMYSYAALYYMNRQLSQDDWTRTRVPSILMPLCMVASDQTDHALISILSKCISHITQNEIDSLVGRNLSYTAHDQSLLDYIKLHSTLFILLLIIVILASTLLWVVLHHHDRHLRQTAEIDYLTHLYNRYGGQRRIQQQLNNCVPGYFCIMDVDKFKSINDIYGHAVGDKALCELSKLLLQLDDAVLMRLGGDEFVVYARSTQPQEVMEQRIQQLLQLAQQIEIPELGIKRFTISMGITFNKATSPVLFTQLYKQADSLLYASKRRGGNFYQFG